MVKDLHAKQQRSNAERTDAILPIVTSGHTKSMHSTQNLEWILDHMRDSLGDDFTFWPLTVTGRHWRQRPTPVS